MSSKRNYYDIELDIDEEVLLRGGILDDIFYFKDLQNRKLFLQSDICQFSVDGIIKHIMQYNAEDRGIEPEKRQPILLYISSKGGEVDPGFALIDVILNSKTPVYTINLGYQYSMGFLIGLAGHKRFSMSNSKFLLHDGFNGAWNSGGKMQDEMEFRKRMEERIKYYILSRSKVSSEEYDNKFRIEWYLFADEAKEKGFTDYIIGVDCDLNEII